MLAPCLGSILFAKSSRLVKAQVEKIEVVAVLGGVGLQSQDLILSRWAKVEYASSMDVRYQEPSFAPYRMALPRRLNIVSRPVMIFARRRWY